MSAPWKFRLAVGAIAFVAVIVAAWRYLPDFSDGAKALFGDAKGEVKQRLE